VSKYIIKLIKLQSVIALIRSAEFLRPGLVAVGQKLIHSQQH